MNAITELRDSSGTPESSRRYFGWRVVAALFVVAVLVWGFGFYGHAVYLAELQRLHGWPSSVISAASTMYFLVSAVLVIYVHDVIRRVGVRNCVLFGALCFALSLALLSCVSSPWQLFAVYFIMSLGWGTLTVGAISNILGLWFDRRRGLAMSLALNGASIGGIVIIPNMVLLIGVEGFGTTMLGASAVVALFMIPLALFVLGKPLPVRETLVQSTNVPVVWTRASALRSAAFWLVSGPFCLALFSQAAFLVHQIAFLETSIGRTSAGVTVAIMTAASVTGRFVMGGMVDRLNLRWFSAISFGSQALALLAMTQFSSVWPLFLLCAIYGFSVGNVITLPALIIQREFPAAAFGMIVSLSTAISQFVYAFGPGVLGAIRDTSASYAPALLFCFVLNVIATGAILLKRS